MQHRMLFKGSTGTERCQEQYLTGWKSLQWPQGPSEAIFHQRAQSAPPRPLGMSKYSGRDRVKTEARTEFSFTWTELYFLFSLEANHS